MLCIQYYHFINNKNAILQYTKNKNRQGWKTGHFLTWLKHWLINCTSWLLRRYLNTVTELMLASFPGFPHLQFLIAKSQGREGLGTSSTDVTSFGCCRTIILDWIGTASSGKQLQMHTATGRLGQVGQIDSPELVSFPDYHHVHSLQRLFSFIIKTVRISILKFASPSWNTALHMTVYVVSIENELALQITIERWYFAWFNTFLNVSLYLLRSP